MGANWQPIETAPKDGTVIRLRNSVMAKSGWSTRGHWGEFRSDVTGKVYTDWCSDYTDDGKLLPTPAGRLICPTEWQPDFDWTEWNEDHGPLNIFDPICARHCTVCEGEDHHWMPDCAPDGEPVMICKHCPAVREWDEEIAEPLPQPPKVEKE